ncbi:sphingosine-1-phosphate lyase 1-like [Gigantopelta aegis]|uniref:sphingosine-1-phosphate lyase 1-like n=1 Tax=Gigantopelta aegis TaxID=1735272 RepID=UPI001B88B143|nr:sphingosine-1-phosphate lyase 1-like [Gigantopelta aegis]
MAEVVDTVLRPVIPVLELVRDLLNSLCAGKEPWQVMIYTCASTLVAVAAYNFIFQEEPITVRAKRTFFKIMRMIPQVKRKIDEQLSSTLIYIRKEKNTHLGGQDYVQYLPKQGLAKDELMIELNKYKALDRGNWQDGWVSGMVYNGQMDLTDIMSTTYGMFAWSNPLHPEVFPNVVKMEAEIVRMTCNMFNGGPKAVGTMSTGGTESILLVCMAYRNMIQEKRGVKFPEIIVPITAHAAFDKAAHILRMKITHIPVDPITCKVDMKAMRRAIGRKTCMLVGSAPGFPHGVIDPIQEIAELGMNNNIPVHVDACLGGFLIAFMGKAGYPIEPFDFQVPGVTSISADTHKYGYAPKGSSVIMYSDAKFRHYQFFQQVNWPGGVYATPTLGGSRAGAIIAACWSAMMFMGESGYVDATRKIITTARYIIEELRKNDHITVMGDPQVSVVAIKSDRFDVYRLVDKLHTRGYTLNPLQFPASIHLCVTLVHTKKGVADRFVKDIRELTTEIMKNPDLKAVGQAAVYGLAQSVPDRSLVKELASMYLDSCYSTDNSSPAANGVA